MDYENGGVPKTIEELKDYCDRNEFTPSKTRFFVGFNYQGAKAFGIYKDEATGEFVVYKNKADGSRSVRYRGTDEEFAVVELYDRLQQEIGNQKLHYAAEMAQRERDKYERGTGSSENQGSFEYIKKFNISDYPVDNSVGTIFSDNSYTSYDRSKSGRSRESGGGGLGLIIGIILMVLSLLFGGGGYGGGGYSDYDSGYSYDYDSGWDSDWDSGDWDSGYTDWDSDW